MHLGSARGCRRRIFWCASWGLWAVTSSLSLLACRGLHQGIKLRSFDQDDLHLGFLHRPLPPSIISGVQPCCDLCSATNIHVSVSSE